jgi:hypothetical protein
VTGNSPEDGAAVAVSRLDLVECDLENQGESGIVVGWWPSALHVLKHYDELTRAPPRYWFYLVILLLIWSAMFFPVIEMVNLWFSFVCFHICL